MEIICIEGPHGSGKTTLCSKLEELGYATLDEGFLDMPEYNITPQSFTMETIWLANWFERILRLSKESPGVYYADRSPFSAVVYAEEGDLLLQVIYAIKKELEVVGITIKTILIDLPKEKLWSQIQDRLKSEPHRIKYKENSREWMEHVVCQYNAIKWDKISDGTIDSIV
tara:strand:+ start:68233 stop:68742 length:510 start_codon:yes stop_codon:yes gene_type:complete